jgi:NTP pyrophosphatase (non-canonical NTP hydrolase)
MEDQMRGDRMTLNEIEHIASYALDVFGDECQVLKCAQECAEASAALLKFHERGDIRDRDHAAEELADVLLSITSAQQVIGFDLVAEWLQTKAVRLSARIDSELDRMGE